MGCALLKVLLREPLTCLELEPARVLVEWRPVVSGLRAPPSLPGRPQTTLAEEPDPSSCRQIVRGAPRGRCSRYAILRARAAEGDPMQVWAPRIVSLLVLPSSAPRALLPSPPLCCVHLCPLSAVSYLGAAPRKAMRSRSRILWDSPPTS